MWFSLWSILRSVKYLNFDQNLPIWTAHHAFLESKHPEVTKNPYYVLFPEGGQKKVSGHGLHVIIKIHVMWSSSSSVRVHISLRFLFFWKTSFFLSVFWFLCFCIFGFQLIFVLCFEFNVILTDVRLSNILQFSSHFIQRIC